MTTFFAGDVLNAADLEAITREPYNTVISAADSGSLSSTESVSLTLPSKTYKAGKAYEIWVGGGITYSVSTAFSSWNIKKGTTTAGAVVVAFPRHPGGSSVGTLEQHLNFRAVFVVGAADVTTSLVVCVAVNSTNTAVHRGTTAGNPRHATILRAGAASSWTNMPVLS